MQEAVNGVAKLLPEALKHSFAFYGPVLIGKPGSGRSFTGLTMKKLLILSIFAVEIKDRR
jgi:hypothetical protein